MKKFTASQRLSLVALTAVLGLCAIYVTPLALVGLVPVVFGVLSQGALSDLGRQLAAWGFYDPSGGPLGRVIAKTADYTILDPFTASTGGDASGTVFTNRGAGGTVIFTLPAPSRALAGCRYEFLGIADFTITVKTATADTLILLNDIAADSLSMQTAGHLIGAHCRVMCDGTSWIAWGDSVGDTFTAAS